MKSRTRRMLARRRRKRRVTLWMYGNLRGRPILAREKVAAYMQQQWDAIAAARPFFKRLQAVEIERSIVYQDVEIIWDP